MISKRLLPIVLLAACSDPPTTEPSTTPPPTWGVPVSGGNLLISADGKRAVAADPDRDRIVSVDLASGQVIADIALETNDEPGRLIEDAVGNVHVALRRGGALVTINPAGQVLARRPVCAEPRGLAFDSASDSIHVACATGELVTFPAGGGDATRSLRLERDLRDVVLLNGEMFVTKFRTAEMLKLDATGAIVSRSKSPTTERIDFNTFNEDTGNNNVPAIPAIAYRTVAHNGSLVMLHQRQVDKQLGTQETGGYGGGCGGESGPVEPAVSVRAANGSVRAVRPAFFGALPVDMAVSPSGDQFAIVLAGSQEVRQVRSAFLPNEDHDPCPFESGENELGPRINDHLGTPTSVAFAPNGMLAIFYPEVPAIALRTQPGVTEQIITLPGGFGYDAGRAMFNEQTPVGIACASCHPEGREDGLVWKFEFGARRTQSIAGGILARAPYHWVGDMNDLPKLMNDVFAVRMAAGTTTNSQRLSLGPWMDRIPAPASAPAIDAAQAEAGRVIFESTEAGCVTCHNGAQLTNNQRVNVGTAGNFKVPSLLGVGARAPFMHDGCAATLLERFTKCGNSQLHGKTSHLDAAQLDALVAYLETL